MTVDRRSMLQAMSGLWASTFVGPLAIAKSAGITFTQFSALSVVLTGYPAPEPVIVEKMLRAFETPARQAALVALANLVSTTPAADLDLALRTHKLNDLAAELVAAWYSGIVTTEQGEKLVLYTDAYVWAAMTYAKPMGICGGATGYWSSPPPV